jgi:magnesium transporter
MGEIMVAEREAQDLAERLEELLRGDDVQAATELLDSLHPADQADLYERLDEDDRERMLAVLSAEGMAHLIEHLDEERVKEVVERMPRASLARVLDYTDNDVAVDVLRMLPPAEGVRTLSQMSTAAEITPLLAHADESAGGLMTRGFVALHKDMTVGEALNFLRVTKPLAEEAYYLYVLDSGNHLLGVVNLRELIVSESDTRIADIMTKDPIAVEPGMDQEEVARLIQHYRLRALPVVDAERVLQGIITADDAMEVVTEEATEDIYRQAGLITEEPVLGPVTTALRRRVPWLLVNLITAFLAALTVSRFEGTISQVAILAAFMPIIAGHAGNTGTQAVTLVVRGIALGEVGPGDAIRIASKEVAFGLVHGLITGFLTATLALVLSENEWVAVVVFVAMIGNVVVAGLAGALIPLGLRAMKIDPALASAIWLTTFTDVMGFLLLLGIGTLLISKLT